MLALIAEDDQDYAEIVTHTLKREGFEVVAFEDLRSAVRFAARRQPDLVVLDVMLPDGSGHTLCQALRKVIPTLPILFLSSLDRSSDVVAALEAGGDDYLVKPFHPGELVARIRALMRRAAPGAGAVAQHRNRIAAGAVAIDVDDQSAWFEESKLDCTPIEVNILTELVRYPGQALSSAFLTEKVWGYSHVTDGTLIKGHVSAIRQKLRDAGGNENLIRTIRGVGYSLMPV